MWKNYKIFAKLWKEWQNLCKTVKRMAKSLQNCETNDKLFAKLWKNDNIFAKLWNEWQTLCRQSATHSNRTAGALRSQRCVLNALIMMPCFFKDDWLIAQKSLRSKGCIHILTYIILYWYIGYVLFALFMNVVSYQVKRSQEVERNNLWHFSEIKRKVGMTFSPQNLLSCSE